MTLILPKSCQKGAEGSALCAIELDCVCSRKDNLVIDKILNSLKNLWDLEFEKLEDRKHKSGEGVPWF